MLTQHKDSHLDHALTEEMIAHIVERFADREGFFIETFGLPEGMGMIPCHLYGPRMGDAPVDEREVSYLNRGDRAWRSRMVVRSPRSTRIVTVIAGPHDGAPCVLYTAFGGPPAPQEPDDPGCKDVEASRLFWAEHALAL